ncbi:MAG TPA: SCP2 sterol-binding domain-containing protein [Acidimicrobiales bacterium]|nr:SCP2 sterol-binding domain-containing protein [Acidimicrobiales bacterium]
MPKYLTQEYMDRAKELAQAFPETPGASVRMQQVITGAPADVANDGEEVKYYTVIENGKTLEQSLGEDPDAEVTLTNSYEDALKIAKGELDANAAFMQGRVKVTGNMAKIMSLMPLTSKPEYKEIQEKLKEETTF